MFIGSYQDRLIDVEASKVGPGRLEDVQVLRCCSSWQSYWLSKGGRRLPLESCVGYDKTTRVAISILPSCNDTLGGCLTA